MARALIMAGGTDAKWTDQGGTGRRHFQMVCGERVIDRQIRQLRERGVNDIWIIAAPGDPGYDIPGTSRVTPEHESWGHEALNGQLLWSDHVKTIQIYGDTIFTDRAMDTVCGFTPHRWMMFGRYDRRGGRRPPWRIKGGGGELFAMSFWPEHRRAWADALELAFSLKARGIIARAGAWEGYRIMGGARGPVVGRHVLYRSVFTNIDDMTDDFDTPGQYEKLVALFERSAVASAPTAEATRTEALEARA